MQRCPGDRVEGHLGTQLGYAGSAWGRANGYVPSGYGSTCVSINQKSWVLLMPPPFPAEPQPTPVVCCCPCLLGDLDDAVLDRMDEALLFDLPSTPQRKVLLELYLDKYIRKAGTEQVGRGGTGEGGMAGRQCLGVGEVP